MRKISFDDVPNEKGRPAVVTRDIAAVLETTDIGIQYYKLNPGDLIGRTYHMHTDQEEVFITLDGTATFETEHGDVEVKEGELIYFSRRDYQRGRNQSDEQSVVLGLGAPKGPTYDNAERLRYCEECEEMTPQRNVDRAGSTATICVECDTETGSWS